LEPLYSLPLLVSSDSVSIVGRRGKTRRIRAVFDRLLHSFLRSRNVGLVADLDTNEYDDQQVTPLEPTMSQNRSSFGQYSQFPTMSPARESFD
jgi:hypothetical protein